MGRGLWKQSHMGALAKQKFLIEALFIEGNDKVFYQQLFFSLYCIMYDLHHSVSAYYTLKLYLWPEEFKTQF